MEVTSPMSRDDVESKSNSEKRRLAAWARKVLRSSRRNNEAGSGEDRLEHVSNRRYHEEENTHVNSVPGIPTCKEWGDPTEMGQVKATKSLGEQLQAAITRSGLTRNQIAKRTGLSYGLIHGFMAGTKDLTLSSASKIAILLGIGLCEAPIRTRRKEVTPK